MKISDQILNKAEIIDENTLKSKAIRDGFGSGLLELGEVNKNVFVINADLEGSLRVTEFKEKFPERYIQVGVAEQIMAGIGNGLANYGKIPFITSFAAFSPGLNWSHIRLAAMSNSNLKVIGSHYGLNVGEDGASAQMLSDVAIMRVLPNMTILSPGDANIAEAATKYASQINGPVYLRITRDKFPIFTKDSAKLVENWEPTQIIKNGTDLTLISTGSLVYETLQTAILLENQSNISVEVININQIKPLLTNIIWESLNKTHKGFVIEDHQIAGGLGSFILEMMSTENKSFPIKLIGINDVFGKSGTAQELYKKHGLERVQLAEKINSLIQIG